MLISICSAYPVYVPIEFKKYPGPIEFEKYPGPIEFEKYPGYEFGYSWPVYKSITKYASSADELKDYWFTFKDQFERSYKEITKPFIVERAVPIPVPGKINSEFSLSNTTDVISDIFFSSAHQSRSDCLH